MNKLKFGLICLPFIVDASRAQKYIPGPQPLINRHIFFGNAEISAMRLSPDGKYVAFMKPWHDIGNIFVKGLHEPFSAAHLLTSETKRPIGRYLWSRDGKQILYTKDHDGDENYNVYAVDPASKPAADADAPRSRDLTGLVGVRVMLYDTPETEPDIVYIGLNDRDKAWHDLYRLKIATGEKTLIRKNTDRITGWLFDRKGQLRLATRSAEHGDTEILRVDADKLTTVYSCSVFEKCGPLQISTEGDKAYIETNKNANLISLVLLDLATGHTKTVDTDPLGRVDLGGALFSEATGELQETWYVADRVKTYYRDKNFAEGNQWLEERFPGHDIVVISRSRDEKLWLVTAMSDTEPGKTFLYAPATHTVTHQFKIRKELPREYLAKMKSISFKSSDGLEIHAYLTLPKGVKPKNLPTLIMPHGGPWSRDLWGYRPIVQFFANRGYAVLQPNFRGSAGFGREFLQRGNLEWGRKMQDDITWGVKYLTAQGITDPKRVGIIGASYGGYATLAGIAFTPGVYAAAVDIAGPSNLVSLLESIPPYWEAQRKMLAVRVGDLHSPGGKKLLEEQSPLYSADNIRTPLLVAQGANDPRVKRHEAEQIVVALRDRDLAVEYLLAPDEGHGFARPINTLALMMEAEKFLATHLDGRYEEGGTVEEVACLQKILVDVKAIVLTNRTVPEASASPSR